MLKRSRRSSKVVDLDDSSAGESNRVHTLGQYRGRDAEAAVEERADRAVRLVERAGELGLNGVIVGDGKLFTLEKYSLD